MSSTSNVTIGLAQYAAEEKSANNHQKALSAIEELSAKGAEIICLPELYDTLYFCNVVDYDHFDLAQSLDSEAFSDMKAIAKEKQVTLLVPYFEKRYRGVYHNSAAIILPDGQIAGHYRKTHIPDDPGFGEKFYFTPGDTGFICTSTKKANISPLICWDQWFPEAARSCSLLGADVLFYPTAIGWNEEQDDATNEKQKQAWIAVQRGHAVANGVYVVAVNRVGKEFTTKFWGGSMVIGPFGELLYQAGEEEENAVIELDLNQIDITRQHWPFFRDRRPQHYKTLEKQFGKPNW